MPWHHSASRRRRLRKRRGSGALETILFLPVFFVVLFGTGEFGMGLIAKQELFTASRGGAGGGALGGNETEVRAAVTRVLGNGNLAAADVQTRLTDDNGVPLASGEPVEVSVDLAANAAAPNLLRMIGYSLDGQHVVARTSMRKE